MNSNTPQGPQWNESVWKILEAINLTDAKVVFELLQKNAQLHDLLEIVLKETRNLENEVRVSRKEVKNLQEVMLEYMAASNSALGMQSGEMKRVLARAKELLGHVVSDVGDS